MVTITVTPLFGIAVVETVVYSLLCFWMGMKTGGARKKFGVKLPAAVREQGGLCV